MSLLLPFHILAGTLVLVSGYVALAASKGAALHRKSGMLFVYMMVIISMTGLLMSASSKSPETNIATALLTLYLVITGMTTVGPRTDWSHRLDVSAMILAFALAAGCFVLAAVATGAGGPRAFVAYPLVMFGAVALAGAVGDRRMIRDGVLRGSARLQRHLWRLCFALFVSALALVAGRLPKALQIPALNAAGVVAPLAAMAYWKWRLRPRHVARTATRLTVSEAVR